MKTLGLIKIGGGLITDKRTPFSVRQKVMHTVACEIKDLIERHPDLHIVLGNGAGSFGHYVASQHMRSTDPKADWKRATCEIHHSVVRLNALFVQELLDAGVNAFSVSPSSCMVCVDGNPAEFSLSSVVELLERGIVPVMYGDIVPDRTRVASIVSTEKLLGLLAEKFRGSYERIVVSYVGEEKGVLDERGRVLSRISPATLVKLQKHITGATGYDVTGGMLQKVQHALDVARIAKRVYIISGHEKGAIGKTFEGRRVGSRIVR